MSNNDDFPRAWQGRMATSPKQPPKRPRAKPKGEAVLMPVDLDDRALTERIATRNEAGFVLPPDMPTPPVKLIVAIVARHFNVPQKDLLSHSCYQPHVKARHMAFYAVRKLTRRSYPDIGRRMGGWDHTTVLHAFHRIDARCLVYAAERIEAEAVLEKVRHALYEALSPKLTAPLVADMADNIREAA